MECSKGSPRRFSREELCGIPQLIADRVQRIREGLISGAVIDVERERSRAYWRLRELLSLARLFGGGVPSLSCLNKDRRKDTFAPHGIEMLSFDEAHGACDALAAWAEGRLVQQAKSPANCELQDGPTEANWPPDSGWHFRPGQWAYEGQIFDQPFERLWKLLKRFAEARRPLTKDDLRHNNDQPSDPGIEDSSVRRDISDLRMHIRASLGVEGDPIPIMGRGQNATYRLALASQNDRE